MAKFNLKEFDDFGARSSMISEHAAQGRSGRSLSSSMTLRS